MHKGYAGDPQTFLTSPPEATLDRGRGIPESAHGRVPSSPSGRNLAHHSHR
ncbi:MAG: hypothetical protein KKA36_06240 [Gammaproteobacteria bacterium]|nr:hypothetical protein [Gammaproteobacteria bacterium]MBU2478672.1 hypothetical protein [Gammaproteobacteria bacterium]